MDFTVFFVAIYNLNVSNIPDSIEEVVSVLQSISHANISGVLELVKRDVKQIVAWAVAAAAKFATLYVIVVKIICGVMASSLLASGTLKEPMLKALPATFSWPQLFTALIGGAIALLIVPVLKKALHR